MCTVWNLKAIVFFKKLTDNYGNIIVPQNLSQAIYKLLNIAFFSDIEL